VQRQPFDHALEMRLADRTRRPRLAEALRRERDPPRLGR